MNRRPSVQLYGFRIAAFFDVIKSFGKSVSLVLSPGLRVSGMKWGRWAGGSFGTRSDAQGAYDQVVHQDDRSEDRQTEWDEGRRVSGGSRAVQWDGVVWIRGKWTRSRGHDDVLSSAVVRLDNAVG